MLSAVPAAGHAQIFPAWPIRVIVPTAAGGAGDIVARAIGQKLTDRWGQQVIVDNRTGIIGTEIAARAAPNGCTLLLSTTALAVREAVYRKLQREIAAIVQSPELRQRFTADAADAVGSTPEEFAVFLKTKVVRWTRVAR